MGAYKDFYREIWNERKKCDPEWGEYAECENCGVRIYECMLTVHNFSHTLSKGAAPELKFAKSNVKIICTDEHINKHQHGM